MFVKTALRFHWPTINITRAWWLQDFCYTDTILHGYTATHTTIFLLLIWLLLC